MRDDLSTAAAGERPAGGGGGYAPPEVAIVAPTLNEKDNVLRLRDALDSSLKGLPWELIFVDDDSTDGTHEILLQEAKRDPRVRVIRRIGRRGLSTAAIEGVLSSSAPLVAVIDADMQHDEKVLPQMIETLKREGADLVVGTRYAEGGGTGDWSARRRLASRLATKVAGLVVKADLSDPMSGFFLIRREAFDRAVKRLSGQGYKILLDLVASSKPPLKIAEVPYTFRLRTAGESKLDSAVTWEYLMLLADKMVGRYVPIRFVMFMIVGAAGVLVHMGVLTAFYQLVHSNFTWAQTIATVAAMTFNFFVNNQLTYRDRRRKGWGLVTGLLSFYAVCSIGAVANVGIAGYIFAQNYAWWLSGIAGVVVGAVWNYAASSVYTWRR